MGRSLFVQSARLLRQLSRQVRAAGSRRERQPSSRHSRVTEGASGGAQVSDFRCVVREDESRTRQGWIERCWNTQTLDRSQVRTRNVLCGASVAASSLLHGRWESTPWRLRENIRAKIIENGHVDSA